MVEDAIRHPSQFSVKVETVKGEEDDPDESDTDPDAIDMFERHAYASTSSPSSGAVPIDEQDDSATASNDESDENVQHQPLDPDTQKIHSRIDDYIKRGGSLPTIDVSDLLGRSFISNPDVNGEKRHIQIDSIEATKDATADYTERLYKFKCKVKDKVYEEIMTYNRMLEWVDRDVHRDDFYNFTAIEAH